MLMLIAVSSRYYFSRLDSQKKECEHRLSDVSLQLTALAGVRPKGSFPGSLQELSISVSGWKDSWAQAKPECPLGTTYLYKVAPDFQNFTLSCSAGHHGGKPGFPYVSSRQGLVRE